MVSTRCSLTSCTALVRQLWSEQIMPSHTCPWCQVDFTSAPVLKRHKIADHSGVPLPRNKPTATPSDNVDTARSPNSNDTGNAAATVSAILQPDSGSDVHASDAAEYDCPCGGGNEQDLEAGYDFLPDITREDYETIVEQQQEESYDLDLEVLARLKLRVLWIFRLLALHSHSQDAV